MPRSPLKMRRRSFSLPASLYARLEAAAASSGVSVGEMLRRVVDLHLPAEHLYRQGAAADVARLQSEMGREG